MALGHLTCIVIMIFGKFWSKRSDYGSGIKTVCNIAKILIYLMSLNWVLIDALKVSKQELKVGDSCPRLVTLLQLFENYRQLEYSLFYCQLGALCLYLLTCKFLKRAKLACTKPQKIKELTRQGADPFWTLLLGETTFDFMRQENFFMTIISTIYLNILIGMVGQFIVFKKEHVNFDAAKLNFVIQGFNSGQMIFVINLFWRGTNFSQLFSRFSVAVMFAFFICDLIFIAAVVILI